MIQCKHYPTCGGCSSQEVSYEEQLARKTAHYLTTFGALAEGVKIHPILACKTPWHYRNKMEFSFSQNRAGEHFLGLIMRGSRRRHVMNIEECHLTSSWFSEVLNSVRSWWKESTLKAYHPYSNTGSLRTLILREGKRTQEKMVILTVSGEPEFALKKKEIEGYVDAVKRALPQGEVSIFLCVQQLQKGSPTQFYEMHLAGRDHILEKMEIASKTYTFKISPRSFFQPNPLQAELLYQRALEMSSADHETELLDLYCGTATLAMVFAHRVKRAYGIELCKEAVLDARCNLELNQIQNVEVEWGDVGKVLQEKNRPFTHLIVDPPRSGLNEEAIVQILRLSPKEIVYVSCNPTTQAENIKRFVEKGYALIELQPVDQFPHTPHLESIALLRRA
jgi:23S rRNA (uracil1939-C5)-methyltransferase